MLHNPNAASGRGAIAKFHIKRDTTEPWLGSGNRVALGDDKRFGMAPTPYRLEFYRDENGKEPVLAWLRNLAPRKRRAMGVALFEILQYEGPRVIGTTFGRQLGGGIFEFRLDQDSTQILSRRGKSARSEPWDPVKILLRVFCYAHGERIVLLLAAYDKAERPSAPHQQEQIELSRSRLKDWKRRG